MPPKAFSIPTIAALLALSGASLTQAQSVYSEVQGALPMTLKAQSDTIVSVPFASESAYSGAVDSVSINGNAVTITPSGTPGWTVDAYKTLYYVRFTSGAKAGMYYQVTANAAGTLTVDAAGDDLSGVLTADTFKLFKFWTLGTLFLDNDLNGIIASTGLATRNGTDVLIYPTDYIGKNASPATYFYYTGTVIPNTCWRKVGVTTNQDDTILWPDTHIVIRQKGSTASPITVDQTFISAGIVEISKISVPLNQSLTTEVDHRITHGRPVGVKLIDLGLHGTTSFVSSTSLATTKDKIYVYDNSVVQLNKPVAKTYFYYTGTATPNNCWRKIGDTLNHDNDIINPSEGFILRKAIATSTGSIVWTEGNL